MGCPGVLGPIASALLKKTKWRSRPALPRMTERRFSVPPTLTRMYSSGLRALVRPAAWTTASWPSTRLARAEDESMLPYTNRTGRLERARVLSGSRARHVTSCPSRTSASTRWLPMNPVAPVTAILMTSLRAAAFPGGARTLPASRYVACGALSRSVAAGVAAGSVAAGVPGREPALDFLSDVRWKLAAGILRERTHHLVEPEPCLGSAAD